MSRRKKSSEGFTLVEVLIGATLAGLIMTSVMSSYLFIGRSLARLASLQLLENESRNALAYLSRDFALTQAVKSGTAPTASAVTLVLPAGEVAYAYDSTTGALRRQATFGVSPDLTFLRNDSCRGTTFAFRYYTTTAGSPADQTVPGTNVPFSIKQIQVAFVVESPTTWAAGTRTRFETASARYYFRNRGGPDGT